MTPSDSEWVNFQGSSNAELVGWLDDNGDHWTLIDCPTLGMGLAHPNQIGSDSDDS